MTKGQIDTKSDEQKMPMGQQMGSGDRATEPVSSDVEVAEPQPTARKRTQTREVIPPARYRDHLERLINERGVM